MLATNASACRVPLRFTRPTRSCLADANSAQVTLSYSLINKRSIYDKSHGHDYNSIKSTPQILVDRAIAFQIWARTLARYASFHPARLILTHKEPFDGSLRMRL